MIPFLVFSQTQKIESLKSTFYQTTDNDQKLDILILLLDNSHSLHTDTFSKYISLGEKINNQIKNEELKWRLEIFKVAALAKKNSLKEANELLVQIEKNCPEKYKHTKVQAVIYNTKGSFLVRQGQFKEAINIYYQLINLGEEIKSAEYIMKGQSGLAWSYLEMGKYTDCINWCRKVITSNVDKSLQKYKVSSYLNIASSYNNLVKYDSAIYFINNAIQLSTKEENISILCNALNVRSILYLNLKENKKAKDDLLAALEIRKKIGDLFFIVSDMADLGVFYTENGDTKKGINTVKEALYIVEKNNITTKKIHILDILSYCYYKDNDMSNYAQTLEKIIKEKDDLYKRNTSDELAALTAKYDLQKKENTIIQQQLALVKSRSWLYGSIILFVISLMIAYLVYKNYQHKEKIKLASFIQSEKVRHDKEVYMAKEFERKRIASDLHDNIGVYASAIIANVNTIKKDRTSIESTSLQLEDNANHIVNELSNAVWVLKNEQIELTALSDKIKSWLKRMCDNFPTINYHIQENIEQDIIFTPNQVLQLLSVLQESINNSFKHSQCSNIYIKIASKETWRIEVADDGIGFDESFTSKGNGISNMKERMRICNWNFEIKNQLTIGTKIIISN